MVRKIRIDSPDGGTHEAAEVGFQPTAEPWCEYLLDDGTVVRLKPVVTNIYHIEGQVDHKGQPAYLVESNNVVTVSAAPKEIT